MTDFDIPNALNSFVETDPPRKILHVVTGLAENHGSPGFDAQAKNEMMQAIGKLIGGRGGFDSYKIVWSAVPPVTSG